MSSFFSLMLVLIAFSQCLAATIDVKGQGGHSGASNLYASSARSGGRGRSGKDLKVWLTPLSNNRILMRYQVGNAEIKKRILRYHEGLWLLTQGGDGGTAMPARIENFSRLGGWQGADGGIGGSGGNIEIYTPDLKTLTQITTIDISPGKGTNGSRGVRSERDGRDASNGNWGTVKIFELSKNGKIKKEYDVTKHNIRDYPFRPWLLHAVIYGFKVKRELELGKNFKKGEKISVSNIEIKNNGPLPLPAGTEFKISGANFDNGIVRLKRKLNPHKTVTLRKAIEGTVKKSSKTLELTATSEAYGFKIVSDPCVLLLNSGLEDLPGLEDSNEQQGD